MIHPEAKAVIKHSKSVLILGDSHMYGNFGHILHNNFSVKMGHDVTSIAVCPATPRTYLQTRIKAYCGLRIRKSKAHRGFKTTVRKVKGDTQPLKAQLDMTRPHLVVIALGTNMGNQSHKNIFQHSMDLVKSIHKHAPNAQIVWLGPPNYRGADRISNALRQAMNQTHIAQYFEGTGYNRTRPLPKKNPHFGKRQAGLWADYMFQKLKYIPTQKKSKIVKQKKQPKKKSRTAPPPKFSSIHSQSQPCSIRMGQLKIPNIKFVGLRDQKMEEHPIRLALKETSIPCNLY